METNTATKEIDRLTFALHAAQKHPDYEYCVTFQGDTAHKPMDGWEVNPAMLAGYNGNAGAEIYRSPKAPREFYWMKRLES